MEVSEEVLQIILLNATITIALLKERNEHSISALYEQCDADEDMLYRLLKRRGLVPEERV